MLNQMTPGNGRRSAIPGVAIALVAGLAIGAGVMFMMRGTGAGPAPAAEAEHEELPAGIVEVPEAAQRNAGLQTLTVTRSVVPATIEVTGVVAADESRVGHIRPLARGVIEDVAVTLGARVQQGQVLATYDNIELGELVGSYLSEVAARRQAEADLEVKQRSLERAEQLIKLEAVAQQTLELRRAELKSAEAAVASRKAGVAKVEEQMHRFGLSEADLANLTPDEGTSLHRTASHSILRAPFSGVITKFDVARGELVTSERELMTVSDLSTVWVMADVYEKDLAKVRVNSDVNMRVDAYPDRVFVGRLTYVSDIIDPQTRTAKVRCVIVNPDGALKLDMFVNVGVATTDRRDAIVVPVAAVQQIDGASVVFVRQGPERFLQRPVTLGVTAGAVVEVVSGLEGNEVIAGAGSFYLKTAALRERIGDEH
ncbi:MAG: efflux RND transporter periplasmic adaptor subunit [Vicinamibacterales bacterium]